MATIHSSYIYYTGGGKVPVGYVCCVRYTDDLLGIGNVCVDLSVKGELSLALQYVAVLQSSLLWDSREHASSSAP